MIPTRDTRDLTLRCLRSLGAQSEVEVVVVDDASNDGTAAEVARRHPGVRLLAAGCQLGFTASANRGLAAASGEVLLLLNSDTEVDPGGLDCVAAAFREAPRLGVAGGRLRYPDGAPQWSGGNTPGVSWCFALASGVPAMLRRRSWLRGLLRPPRGTDGGPVDWVTGAAMAIRRQAWEEVGPFDERFTFYCQDLDFCLRAREAGWQVLIVPGFRVMHHHGATVERDSGGIDHSVPEHLWVDLVRWAGKHRGPAAARRIAGALETGARVRLALRRLVAPFLRSGRRERWHRDTMLYRRALAAVRALPVAEPGDQPG